MNSAVFLDRDGVIIQNRVNYVRSWNDVEFLPYSLQALEKLSQSPNKIVITTNQSAIGAVLSHLMGHSDKYTNYRNDHQGRWPCMDPSSAPMSLIIIAFVETLPGLILQAADALSIDLPSSVMVGDALSDIQAGYAARIKTLIMVKTGRGLDQIQLARTMISPDFIITDQLSSAVEIILSQSIL
jgi:D-glycero-D-manno-heptose 1,7-bisphosphate phosphatase